MASAEDAEDLVATLLALAGAQRDLGRAGEARACGTEAVQVLKASPETSPHTLAETLVFAARTQIQSDPGQAVPLLEEASQLLAPEGAAEPAERVTVLDLLAAAYRALGREDLAREATAAADGIVAASTDILAGEDIAALLALGQVLIDRGDLEQAGIALGRAKAVLQARPPAEAAPEKRALSGLMDTLGRAHERRRAYPEALAAYREALGLVDAAADPRFYGVILHDIADVHRAQGDLDEAARLYREAVDRKRQGDASARDQVTTLRALGVTYEDLGRRGAQGAYDQALAAYREALGLVDAAADPRWYGVILHDIADVHRAQGDLDEAARVYRQAVDRKRQAVASAEDAKDRSPRSGRLASPMRTWGGGARRAPMTGRWPRTGRRWGWSTPQPIPGSTG